MSGFPDDSPAQFAKCTKEVLELRHRLGYRDDDDDDDDYYYYYYLTAVRLTPGGIITVHIYTQTVH
jgi:hypothetical protein